LTSIHFIINPIAGKGNHKLTKVLLEDYFEPSCFTISVKETGYKKHAAQLAKTAINEGANIIVACGGDGTINEVATALVGTDIKLGIIPIGSGNGLASNLNISKNNREAILAIKAAKSIKIDVGSVNGTYFFSNTGFGFDADVIKNYEASERRTLSCYIKASLTSFKNYNKNKKLVIKINGVNEVINPFLIFISNSNQLGYSFSLTPKASLQDGLLDVVLVPKIGKLKMLLFGICMLIKKPEILPWVQCFKSNSLSLLRKEGAFFQSQIDGELVTIKESSVSVTIKSKALSIII